MPSSPQLRRRFKLRQQKNQTMTWIKEGEYWFLREREMVKVRIARRLGGVGGIRLTGKLESREPRTTGSSRVTRLPKPRTSNSSNWTTSRAKRHRCTCESTISLATSVG